MRRVSRTHLKKSIFEAKRGRILKVIEFNCSWTATSKDHVSDPMEMSEGSVLLVF